MAFKQNVSCSKKVAKVKHRSVLNSSIVEAAMLVHSPFNFS